jgi:hypothetical protein
MKKLMSLSVALGLLAGAGAVFAQAPAQQDQPKAEKKGHKTNTDKKESRGTQGTEKEEVAS